MVLSPSPNPRPGPANAGPGHIQWLRAMTDLAGASVRLAWPATVAALGAFASLQFTRLRFADQFFREVYVSRPPTVSPAIIAKYASWLFRHGTAATGAGGPYAMSFAVDEAKRWWLHENPEGVAIRVAVAVLSASAWAVILAGIGVRRAARSRRVPYQLSFATRVRMSCVMLRSAWLWSVAAAILAGTLVWHVGYDREGGTRPMVSGMFPTAVQGGVMLAIWGVLSAWMALAFQRWSLYACVGEPGSETRVCPRCRYPLRGLNASKCPECGLVMDVRTWGLDHSVRPAQSKITKRMAVGLAVSMLAVFVAAIASPGVNDWLRLAPRGDGCYRPTYVFEPGLDRREFQTLYGVFTLDVRAEPDGGHDGNRFLVAWTLQGASVAGPAHGTFSISPNPTPIGEKYMPESHETALGTLRLYMHTDDPRLYIEAPPLIFDSGRVNYSPSDRGLGWTDQDAPASGKGAR